ncbi:AraC family transcriptional regulator [Pedobacter polaris]|uniref:AraC family transcriptional regulator n=1 Tax=Pedobacter polaris TaxID=2571273 RepID=A0A4U1CK39_9SPHI|nr:AraC family transcriptional regulator [Pedobacter polaris]TKC05364.1 AraC family transcriptional regulator [Pedobacter polaris]
MKVIHYTVPVANEDSIVIQNETSPYFYNYLHRHKEAQITLILRGEGTFIVGNYTQPFKEGEVYFIGANQPHMFKGGLNEKIPEMGAHAIHIFFDQNYLKPLLSFPEFNKVSKFFKPNLGSLHLPSKYSATVAKDILSISKLGGLDRLVKFTYLLQFFATNVSNWKSLSTGLSFNSITESEGIRMNLVLQYTTEHFSKQISLLKISSIAHMTPHGFCRYFKKHTRKTYIYFLNEIRINEACRLLLKDHMDSIATIAYSTGFNNACTFNRAFKKMMGVSPSDYVKVYKLKMESV